MFLIVDVGNTRVKVAVYENDVVVDSIVFLKTKIIEELEKIILKYRISNSIVSSVATFSKNEEGKIIEMINPIFLNHETKVPFENKYDTPKTLGVDRIALAAAAVSKFPEKNTLVIDAGTCITFDFITKDKKYLGGAISPGIAMRYRALNAFISKLPLLKKRHITDFIGRNTDTSMHSGVVNGVYNEIMGLINQYKAGYQDLTIVLTGGDTKFLAEQLKSVIFAHPNFVLEGLHTILIYNLEDD